MSQREKILRGAYKQLAVSNKGKQANGEYRIFSDSFDKDSRLFVGYVAENLHKVGMANHANKLMIQYGNKVKESGLTGLRESYIDRTFGDELPKENRKNLLDAMAKYDGNTWWESDDPVTIGMYQLFEQF